MEEADRWSGRLDMIWDSLHPMQVRYLAALRRWRNKVPPDSPERRQGVLGRPAQAWDFQEARCTKQELLSRLSDRLGPN